MELQASQDIRSFPGIKMSSKTHVCTKSMKLISEEPVAGLSEQCHVYPGLRVQSGNVFQSWVEKWPESVTVRAGDRRHPSRRAELASTPGQRGPCVSASSGDPARHAGSGGLRAAEG